MKRSASSISRGAKRPIQKTIVAVRVNLQNTMASTRQQICAPTTFPCTLTGLKWHLGFEVNNTFVSTNVNIDMYWAIVHWRAPVSSISNLTLFPGATVPADIDGRDLYRPARDVLAFGVVSHRWDNNTVAEMSVTETDKDECKTKRKFARGDSLYLVFYPVVNDGVNSFFCRGLVQYFLQE